MTRIRNYIGIDISKDWLDVAILNEKIKEPLFENRIGNTTVDLQKLKKKLASRHIPLNKSSLIVCENTGIYKKTLVDFCSKQRCLFSVEVPQRIKKSLGIQRGKNDKIDAKRIAEYALINKHKITFWNNPRKDVLKLKDLLANRSRLVSAKTQLQKSLKEFGKFYTTKNSGYFEKLNKSAIEGIIDSLDGINSEIRCIVQKDQSIGNQTKLLTSVPGIGTIIALQLICHTNEFSICQSGKQLACYVGVAPFEHSSGSSIRGKSRVSHFANKKLKSLLHMGAISSLRVKNGELGKYYKRKIKEGKHSMSVLNAIKNKIILRAVAVIKRGTPYVNANSKFK